MIKSFECLKSIINNEKEIMLGTSEAWSMSLLSWCPSKPAYYITSLSCRQLIQKNPRTKPGTTE